MIFVLVSDTGFKIEMGQPHGIYRNYLLFNNMLKNSLFISSTAFIFLKNKVLIFILIFLPALSFSQNRNSISFGLGMLSERFSDQNLASLDFGGSGLLGKADL
jgi:hypothetical protein